MIDSNNFNIKKEKKTKGKRIAIENIGISCSCLIYYDNDEIKKAKCFFYPLLSTNKEKKKVDRMLSKEYKLWLKTLWKNGFLEEDDSDIKELDKSE